MVNSEMLWLKTNLSFSSFSFYFYPTTIYVFNHTSKKFPKEVVNNNSVIVWRFVYISTFVKGNHNIGHKFSGKSSWLTLLKIWLILGARTLVPHFKCFTCSPSISYTFPPTNLFMPQLISSMVKNLIVVLIIGGLCIFFPHSYNIVTYSKYWDPTIIFSICFLFYCNSFQKLLGIYFSRVINSTLLIFT